MVKIIR